MNVTEITLVNVPLGVIKFSRVNGISPLGAW